MQHLYPGPVRGVDERGHPSQHARVAGLAGQLGQGAAFAHDPALAFDGEERGGGGSAGGGEIGWAATGLRHGSPWRGGRRGPMIPDTQSDVKGWVSWPEPSVRSGAAAAS
ncbi:hypothetical protein GCM10010286_52380 [Streptomyces toxytricini]|nr:hypothetical protein GCM10010286_52380 [Streptomyces toxytricini]